MCALNFFKANVALFMNGYFRNTKGNGLGSNLVVESVIDLASARNAVWQLCIIKQFSSLIGNLTHVNRGSCSGDNSFEIYIH